MYRGSSSGRQMNQKTRVSRLSSVLLDTVARDLVTGHDKADRPTISVGQPPTRR
jgi:hypothetical protein